MWSTHSWAQPLVSACSLGRHHRSGRTRSSHRGRAGAPRHRKIRARVNGPRRRRRRARIRHAHSISVTAYGSTCRTSCVPRVSRRGDGGTSKGRESGTPPPPSSRSTFTLTRAQTHELWTSCARIIAVVVVQYRTYVYKRSVVVVVVVVVCVPHRKKKDTDVSPPARQRYVNAPAAAAASACFARACAVHSNVSL